MPKLKTGFLVASLALVLAGCQSERFAPLRNSPAPQPLAPAPSGTVTSNQLPAPTDPNSGPAFPEAPQEETQTAALDPNAPGAEASAGDISKNGLVGSWNVSSGGASCQMFLTLTKYGNASRGGTRGCNNELANMRGWDVQGKQLVIYNEGGDAIARLYSSGSSRLDGQTTGSAPVTLSR